MNGTNVSRRGLACVLLALAFGAARPSAAFNLLQSFVNGRTTNPGISVVACNDPAGFVHWSTSNINFRHNPAGQGFDKAAQLYNALNGWNFVTGVTHTPTYAGTTNAGFVHDGINTLLWGEDAGCTGGCVALTALVLQQPGQILIDTDVVFRQSVAWTTNGTPVDLWSVAAHEVGHSLGIAHSPIGTATMFFNYFGTGANWRSLEADDRAAIQCTQNVFPPAVTCVPDGGADDTFFVNSCCSGMAVNGSTYCPSPGNCHQVCATPLVNGCVPSGGVDDILFQTSCCSGASVPFSARCLNPADWNNGWASCIQTCQ